MGVIEEVPKATDPTPQWRSRVRIGLIECEEGEKRCMIREIQALAHTCAYRKEKGGQETPTHKDWNYTFKFSTSLCRGKQRSLFRTSCSRSPSQRSSVSVLPSPFCISSSAVQTQVLNSKFCLLGSWFWFLGPAPSCILP